ncbi:hypothetical protein P5673_016108 [Acropora cervicornis]|nr:hypothetical protein P5673_016108 [Acropora cervicornis]
MSDCSYF